MWQDRIEQAKIEHKAHHMIPKEKVEMAQHQSCDKIGSIKHKSNTKLKLPLKQSSPFQKQCKQNSPLPNYDLCKTLPLVDNASIKVQQCKRSAKHAMKGFNLQSFSNRPKALKYATGELTLEKRVISKHSKPSWRYYDIIRRQKHDYEI